MGGVTSIYKVLDITERVKQAIAAEGRLHEPTEACGFVVVADGEQKILPCKNIAGDTRGEDMFVMDGTALDWALKQGEVVAIYHTHPNTPPIASEADRRGCLNTGLPWVICSPDDSLGCSIIEPDNPQPEPPLLGREFVWGVFDCYALLRDYYVQEFGIKLGEHDRGLLFAWDIDPTWDKFREFFEEEGFVEIKKDTPLQKGDVFLMNIRSPIINHCGVLVDPDKNIFYHHLLDQLSVAAIYGGWFERVTRITLRHHANADRFV